MKKLLSSLVLGAFCCTLIAAKKTPQTSSKTYCITDFGAKAGDVEVQTPQIQAAIDKAFNEGGGTVVIPEGTFISGGLFFKAGVNLEVKKGGVLKASVQDDDFPVIPTRFEGIEKPWKCALLNIDHSPGVQFYGEGTIEGSGEFWKTAPFGNSGRPRVICFTDSPGGKLSGVNFLNQGSWCVHVLYTKGFTIEGLRIVAQHDIPSSDGIDIDSSSDIHIDNCYIECNDDCISIKCGKDDDGRRVGRPSENILIENCHFGYGGSGVTMGSEISGGIRNVTVQNCLIDGGNKAPVRFKSQPSRGAVVENITFKNLILQGTQKAFEFNMEWRMKPPLAPAHEPLTVLKNIRVINVKGTCGYVGLMHAFKDGPVMDIRFEDCHIEAKTGFIIENIEKPNLSGLELIVSEGPALIVQ